MSPLDPTHSENPLYPPYHQAHSTALANGVDHYIDPQTGYLVFTEHFHQKRGSCCHSTCRHCPFQ